MIQDIEKFFLERGILVEERVIKEIEKRGGLVYLDKIQGKLNFQSPVFTFKDLPADNEFSIVKEFHLNGFPGISGSFVDIFQNRFNVLSKKIKSRSLSHHFVSIKKAKISGDNVDTIGLVVDSSVSKKGYKIIEIEDQEDSIKVILGQKFNDLVFHDEVIGVSGRISKDGTAIFAESIVRPELEKRKEIYENGQDVLVISDIHVGSKNFMNDNFMNLIDYVNNSNVSYIIMNGDLVDGIGVYPDQEKDLEIPDIIKQYKRLAELISKINGNIKVILIPGNHDMVYPTEPQNPLPREINELFPPNVISLSNPVWVEIGRRIFLLYHGTSIMDFVESMPGTSLNDSDKVMKEMLRRGHLAPIYGKNLSFIPLKEDYYVIDPVPDVFITGHIHDHSITSYRGILAVNASTFQEQTDYQKMMNFNPKPGIGTLINTSDLSYRLVKF
ncbi:MAG: metallophosphoesterase [Thermoplasmata archaeon]